MAMAFNMFLENARSRYLRAALLAALAALLTFYALRIIERNRQWGDPFLLYQHDAALEPQSFLLHANLGVEYFRRGMLAEAKREFILSNEAAPGKAYYTSMNNLGVIYAREGRIAEAMECYKKSIAQANYILAYNNLGEIYHALGRYQDEVANYEDAVRNLPPIADMIYRLAVAYYYVGDFGKARAAFQKVETMQPDYLETRKYLGAL